jgi:ABC-type proline/glycine betaine transport system ATPase subunit
MIALDGVSTSYAGRQAVSPLTLPIPKGQFVAFPGATQSLANSGEPKP